jgi:hypothetical protein
MTRRLIGGLLLLALLPCASAQDLKWHSVGLRTGFSSTDYSHPFMQSELFGAWAFRGQWRWGSNWSWTARLEHSSGWLHCQGQDGYVGTLGPCFTLKNRRCPVSIDAGLRPTILSEYTFPNRDFGIPFQFTSHLGFEWAIRSHWKLGYRFQHMSNAGLGSPNPGLNLHMFGVSYQF